MFVRKTRHFVEFAFILLIVCILSFFLMKVVLMFKRSHADDLEFNPDADQSQIEILDEN